MTGHVCDEVGLMASGVFVEFFSRFNRVLSNYTDNRIGEKKVRSGLYRSTYGGLDDWNIFNYLCTQLFQLSLWPNERSANYSADAILKWHDHRHTRQKENRKTRMRWKCINGRKSGY